MPTRKSAPKRSLNGAARFRPAWVPWLWVTLPVLAIVSFYIYPFITTVYVSFTKTKPIVFKERGEDGQTIKTLSVSSMKLIRLDTDGKMGSLAITLEDGRELRICSAYLKEMQAARFTFETKVDDEE